MLDEVRELWRYRELLFTMVRRELKIRYKNSFFGFFWSFINPALTVIVFTLVFKYIMQVKIPNYSAYLLAALLPFQFFQQSLMDASQSVAGSLSIIRKIYFPREILPLAMILANFVHLILAFAVFFLFLLVTYLRHPQVVPFQVTTIYLPILLAIILCLTTGLGLLVSALNVFYEDVKYMVGIGLFLLLYICPVMYLSEFVTYSPSLSDKPWASMLYHLNPMATLCTAFRKTLLAPQNAHVAGREVPPLPIDWLMIGIAAITSLAILFIGYRVFNRFKWRFVERS